MTISFPSHLITVRRQRSVGTFGGVERTNFSTTFTATRADIQPAGIERTEMVGGRIGSTFEAFVDASFDIREGDQIVSGGYTYSVKGMAKYTGAGLLDHQHLILVREEGLN